MSDTPESDDPRFVQAMKDWTPVIHGQAIGVGNVLMLDADGVACVRDALNRARIAGYCRGFADGQEAPHE